MSLFFYKECEKIVRKASLANIVDLEILSFNYGWYRGLWMKFSHKQYVVFGWPEQMLDSYIWTFGTTTFCTK